MQPEYLLQPKKYSLLGLCVQSFLEALGQFTLKVTAQRATLSSTSIFQGQSKGHSVMGLALRWH